MSLLRAQTAADDLTATLADDPTVSAIDDLWQTDDRHFYRVEWSYESHCRLSLLLQSQGLLLRSQGIDSQWRFDLLYPDRESLRQANECCKQFGLPLTIDTIRSLSSNQRTQYGLTPVQYETLTYAHQQDYFQVPREHTLDELAEQLEIFHQAISERLRRAHATLINVTLCDSQPTVPPVPSTTTLL